LTKKKRTTKKIDILPRPSPNLHNLNAVIQNVPSLFYHPALFLDYGKKNSFKNNNNSELQNFMHDRFWGAII